MDHHDDARLLARMATHLHDEVGADETTKAIFEQARRVLPEASHISITLHARRGGHTSAGASSELASQADELQYASNEGPCLDAAATGGDAWIRSGHLGADPRWPTWGPRAQVLGAHSIFAVRLQRRDKPFGAINIYSERPSQFLDPANVDRTLLWSTHAASALASARSESGLSTAIGARHRVGLAQGILMLRYGVDENAAFHLLTRVASQLETRLRVVASHVVEHHDLPIVKPDS